jgi:hypothetical protein
VTCIIAHMLSWAVFYVFRYASVPQPVDRRVGKAICVIAEPVAAHCYCCVIKTLLHDRAYLPRTAYTAFSPCFVD